MFTKQERTIAEDARALTTIQIAQKIESLYVYEGMPEELAHLLSQMMSDNGADLYKRRLILLPLHPDWVSLILDRKKTLELRLSFPSIYGSFTALLYETKQDGGRGLVVGEFTCDGYDEIPWIQEVSDLPFVNETEDYYYINGEQLAKLNLTYQQVKDYGKKRPLYAWHITDVLEYQKPKSLSNYYRPDAPHYALSRPPQMYFEVKEILGD